MTTAEEFKKLAAEARSKSNARLQYERILEDMMEAVKDGKCAMPLRKYTLEGIKFAHQGARLTDEEAEQLYKDQEEVYEYFRKDGFTVREMDIELPSTLDISMSEQVRQQIEFAKRIAEKDVLIIWDVDGFDGESEKPSIIV